MVARAIAYGTPTCDLPSPLPCPRCLSPCAQRLLLASGKVLEAAGGRGSLRVLPLHGSLSSAEQSKVFAR